MNATEQKAAAKKFAEYWKDKGDEKQETARFWIELLGNVLGVAEAPTENITLTDESELSNLPILHTRGDDKLTEVYVIGKATLRKMWKGQV